MSIRTILVDDEKLAIQGLQLRLAKFPDVEIIDTCANGREAIRKIKTERPDLVFLDIQMPGFDGFSVVKGVMGLLIGMSVASWFVIGSKSIYLSNAVNRSMRARWNSLSACRCRRP